MPRIEPPGGEVDWPRSEGVLGVVGVAPWATLEFCGALYRAVNATKDWHYPRVLLDINTKLPSRGRHLQLGEADPSPAIAATIQELAGMGATIAVVVCNTAHILYERWAARPPIPVLHIIDETVRAASNAGARCVAPLVSASLAKHDLYGARAASAGMACSLLAPASQSVIEDAIARVKLTGEIGAAGERAIIGVLTELRAKGVDTVLAGCTELSSIGGLCRSVGLQLVDSNEALARAALVRLGVSEELIRSHANGAGGR